jgi:tetratricopeptide (TPR) repeat protein
LVSVLAAISWFGFVQGERFRFGFGIDSRSTPLGAFRFIEENDLPGEVWNEDAWGGAFLWRFWPERRNFIDNRLGVFDEPFFLNVYIPVRDAHPQWQFILDHYGINTLLMELNEKPIGIQEAAFQSHRWALVYWDDQSLLYVRRSSVPVEFVRRFEYRLVNPNNLALSLTNRKELSGIISELERAVSSTERSWAALNSLGVAYGMAGRYTEASRMFRRALEADPGSEAAQANLRVAERRLGGGDGEGA